MFKFKYLVVLMIMVATLTVTTSAYAFTRQDVDLICTILQIIKRPCTDATKVALYGLAENGLVGQPTVTVLSPNGGEVYKKGDTVDIRWKSKNVDSTININLLKSDGTIAYNLVSRIDPTKGSFVDASGPAYSWWIPTDNGLGGFKIAPGLYKIQIIATKYDTGRGVADASDNFFTISSSTTTTPVPQLFTYSGATDSGSRFSVEYPSSWAYRRFSCNIDWVAFWPKTTTPDFSNVNCGMDGTWGNPAIIIQTSGSQPRIILLDNRYQDVFDQMKSSLAYSNSSSVTVLSPSAGDNLRIGDSQTIRINPGISANFPTTSIIIVSLVPEKEGSEIGGIVSCIKQADNQTQFTWDGKTLMNYCGAGDNKYKSLLPGRYFIRFTTDDSMQRVLGTSGIFSVYGNPIPVDLTKITG